MTSRRYHLDSPDAFPYEDSLPAEQSPEGDVAIPGLPAGFLDYQLNYTKTQESLSE